MYKAKSEFRYVGKLVFNLNDIKNKNSIKVAYFDFSIGAPFFVEPLVEVSVYVDSDYNSSYFYDHKFDHNLSSSDFFIIYNVFPNLVKRFKDVVTSFRRNERIDKLLAE